MQKTIEQLQVEIFDINTKNGFWDEERNFGEMIALVHSELSESLEAHRKNKICEENMIWLNAVPDNEIFKDQFKTFVKDTIEDELADAAIRLMDIAQGRGIDLYQHIVAKMRYNSMREHKHGKAY